MTSLDKEQSRLIGRFASRLRFPYAFVLMALLFAVDLVVPDMIPFVDEIGLGLLTALFGMWKRRKQDKPVQAEPETATPPADREHPE